MTPRHHRTWLRVAALVLAVLPLAALAGCTLQQFPQSSLHPRADYANAIQSLLEKLVFWVAVIFVLVEGALIVAVVRFRARPRCAPLVLVPLGLLAACASGAVHGGDDVEPRPENVVGPQLPQRFVERRAFAGGGRHCHRRRH